MIINIRNLSKHSETQLTRWPGPPGQLGPSSSQPRCPGRLTSAKQPLAAATQRTYRTNHVVDTFRILKHVTLHYIIKQPYGRLPYAPWAFFRAVPLCKSHHDLDESVCGYQMPVAINTGVVSMWRIKHHTINVLQ